WERRVAGSAERRGALQGPTASPPGNQAASLLRPCSGRHRTAPSEHPVIRQRQSVFPDPRVRGFQLLAVLFEPARGARFSQGLDQPALARLRNIYAQLARFGEMVAVERDVGGAARPTSRVLAKGVCHAQHVCAYHVRIKVLKGIAREGCAATRSLDAEQAPSPSGAGEARRAEPFDG